MTSSGSSATNWAGEIYNVRYAPTALEQLQQHVSVSLYPFVGRRRNLRDCSVALLSNLREL